MTAIASVDRSASIIHEDTARALQLARQVGQPSYLTRIVRLREAPDPLAFLDQSARALGGGVLWDQSPSGVTFAGAGEAIAMCAGGSARFAALSAAQLDVSRRLVRGTENELFPFIGGSAFGVGRDELSPWHGFPDAKLLAPKVLLQLDRDNSTLRVTVPVEPTSAASDIEAEIDFLLRQSEGWLHSPLPAHAAPVLVRSESCPDRAAWESSVATAVGLIKQRAFDKIVLAREVRLLFDGQISPIATLERLRTADPDATRFAFRSGNSWFVGATPERLVRLRAGRVDVTCLAGSIGMGHDANESRKLAAQLLASAKDREEHEIVVRATMSALEDLCEDVTRLPGTPRVTGARSVQHLESPLRGWLSRAGRVLDLVDRLHPTPAVGGFPQQPALSVITELEEIDRGWYAGPIGWTEPDGSGEFAVAIRSALLTGQSATLFAGCGIVSDSVPAREWNETRLKLRPMLTALGAA